MEDLQNINKTISEIVRNDYRTADVFKRHGINYCCGGQVSLQTACEVKNISSDELLKELEQAVKNINLPNILQFNNWKTDFLIDYIVNVHHEYLKLAVSSLEVSLLSFVNSHKKNYPELEEILQIFQKIQAALENHNRQQEEIIFPYIKQVDSTYRRKETYGNLFVKTLRKPLSEMQADQQHVSNLLNQLRSLTKNYKYPENACTNHRVVFNKLQEFDNDLVQHMHLENNILFPRAIKMEKELLQL